MDWTGTVRQHYLSQCGPRAPSQYPKRRLFVRSRKVSKPRDWYFKLSYRFEIWQAHRQHCCRSACQVSERSDNSKYKFRGFETLRDLTERRLFWYWDGAQIYGVSRSRFHGGTTEEGNCSYLLPLSHRGFVNRKARHSCILTFLCQSICTNLCEGNVPWLWSAIWELFDWRSGIYGEILCSDTHKTELIFIKNA